ncbi:MAG TPA: PAS domain S-box protein, partial [Hyphomicrobiales bacterium]|nr:PAS domain S-box protein [Hyphomicrobiales bacterium]
MPSEQDPHDFRALLEALPIAIYATDAAGRITFYNEAAVKLSGNRPTLGSNKWCVTWRLYRLDGTPLPHEECPMAVALKEQRAIRGVEAIAERPDGSRVLFEPYPTPLFDESGRLCGAVNMLVDLTDRHEASVKAAQLAAIVESSDDAIIGKTLEGRITSWNAGAERIFGYTEAEIIGQPITRIIPPELLEEENHILAQLREGKRIDHSETVRTAKNGRRVDVSITVSPIRGNLGNVVGASNVSRDITERKQAEETQRLLVNELNHRVKNVLANVQGIVQQTLRKTKDPDEFAKSFAGRIQSMARIHSLLTSSAWRGADLRKLLRDQLEIGMIDEARLTAWGPSVRLSPQMAMHVALMLHELATNSVKYGALASPNGRIAVNWTVRDAELIFRWQERGGPQVSAPASNGFGLTLIEHSAESQGGSAHALWEAEGVTWEIALRLEECSSLATPEPVQVKRLQSNADVRPSQELRGKRFLVVEDEPLIALSIASNLEAAGAEVAGPTGNEEKALQLIEDTALDGVLLDANLHGKSAAGIAAILTRRKIPFVFVTGNGREALPKSFAKAAILSKPFSQEQLLFEA